MTPEQSAELKRHLDEAFRAFEAGDDGTARRLCREALSIDPESSTAHSLMGLLYEREGRLSEATGEFETVLEQNPRSRAERQTLRRLRDEDEPDEDEPVAEAPAERSWLAYLLPGLAALLVLAATVVIVGKLTDRGPEVASAATIDEHLARAREAFNRGDYQVAADEAQEVLQLEPTNVQARNIYDRAMAFLAGTQGPPREAAPNAFAQNYYQPGTAPEVQQTPAFGPNAASGTAPNTNQSNFGTPSTGPQRVEPRYSPGLPPLPVVTSPPAGRGGTSQPVRPGLSPYTPGSQLRRTAPATREVADVPTDIRPPEEGQPTQAPSTQQPGRPRQPTVTVGPRQPIEPGAAMPAVEPDSGGSAGQEAQPAAPVDPAVQRFREEQERLRQQRERQRAAELRRLEGR